LARFCTAKYEAPNKSNFKKDYMHLTNYAVNSKSKNFIHSTTHTTTPSTKRTLSALYDTLKTCGVDIATLKQNIAATCGRICAILGPMLEH
jgi:hypothetical protein